MKGFSGFPAEARASIRLPDLFFSELLPDIDHLGELKVTLHVFWLLTRKGGARPYVSGAELATDQRLLDGLTVPGLSPEEALRDALERAVARGTLLRVFAGEGGSRRDWYFVNSEKGRQAVEGLLAGTWMPVESDQPLRLEAQRPNIVVLYEQNIGLVPSLLYDELLEAEDTYPADWIRDAFAAANRANVRKWNYISAILERWRTEGKTDEASRRSDETDWRRFIDGEYADYIEH